MTIQLYRENAKYLDRAYKWVAKVGYTDVGGNEFFTVETGIAVPESDTLAYAREVKRAIAGYLENPAPFDHMRERASRKIATTHSRTAFEESLREAWIEIDDKFAARHDVVSGNKPQAGLHSPSAIK